MPKRIPSLGTVAQLAALLDTSERQVQRLVKEKIVVQTKRGVYDVPASIVGYIRHLKQRADSPEESDELRKEQILLTRAKRETFEIRAAMLKGSAGDMGLLMRLCAQHISVAKNKIMGIPANLSGQLAMETDPNIVRDLIERKIIEALNELSEIDAGQLVLEYVAENGGDVAPAAEDEGE